MVSRRIPSQLFEKKCRTLLYNDEAPRISCSDLRRPGRKARLARHGRKNRLESLFSAIRGTALLAERAARLIGAYSVAVAGSALWGT